MLLNLFRRDAAFECVRFSDRLPFLYSRSGLHFLKEACAVDDGLETSSDEELLSIWIYGSGSQNAAEEVWSVPCVVLWGTDGSFKSG